MRQCGLLCWSDQSLTSERSPVAARYLPSGERAMALMSFRVVLRATGLCVPDADGGILAGRGDVFPIGVDRCAHEAIAVPVKSLCDLTAAGVPSVDSIVPMAAKECVSVGREGEICAWCIGWV